MMLEITTDGVRQHALSPDHLSRNRTDIAYRQVAYAHRFKRELLDAALDPDDQELLQIIAGLCLLGRNIFQVILLMIGNSGTGKSTILKVITSVLGLGNVANLRVPQLAERFEIASFHGKTTLVASDVSGDFLNSKGAFMLKSLVGGDPMQIEHKGVNERSDIVGNFNAIITANTRLKLKLDNDAPAWGRRIVIIEFDKPAPKDVNPNLAQELIVEESEGIFLWMLEGARKALQASQSEGRIPMSQRQRERVEMLLSESDSVRQFARLCIARDENQDVTTSECHAAYLDFCDAQGWQPVAQRVFARQISDLMMELYRSPKRTDIKRGGTNKRGFAKVGLLLAEGDSTQKAA